jgi:RNA polymerase sigma-70 factor, ECF subfamily
MLTADGVMAMLPHPTWFRGREAVAAFLAATPMRADRRWRMIPVRANGQLAFATYWWDEEREVFAAHGISGAHARRSADLPTSQTSSMPS